MGRPADDGEISLREAAERLDVHYMTAYRYVRNGRLAARKVGSEWRVRLGDLRRLTEAEAEEPGAPHVPRGVFRDRYEDRALAGDEAGAWGVVEAAMVSGASPTEVLIDVVAPSMASIGQRWADGELGVADEHQASAVTNRVIGRLGPRFARRGRKRGDVVIGAAAGDRHSLPSAIAADVLRGEGFEVIDLGADTPPESFVQAAEGRGRLRAVVVSVSNSDAAASAADTTAAVRHRFPGAAVFVGGGGVDNEQRAFELGATHWADDARDLARAIRELDSGEREAAAR